MPYKDKDIRRTYARNYYILHKQKIKKQVKLYNKNHKKEKKLYLETYREVHREEHKLWAKKHYQNNMQTLKEQNRLAKLLKRYGLSVKEYEKILEEQKDLCAICSKKLYGSDRCVDHDHETNIVRGLLCRRCNLMLGAAKDNINTLKTAIVYLGGK